ncbi:hypothetical protein BB560_003176 [Smittium megazygosporum]|uniref:Uncharacterized protein n=1 Tax=Smittium megazygosporum TaxID=133381 RepID=A0A2T9ZCP6_9FUNG|nr:hypothetical protein BB560_003176 [Smittium megazygosporum]
MLFDKLLKQAQSKPPTTTSSRLLEEKRKKLEKEKADAAKRRSLINRLDSPAPVPTAAPTPNTATPSDALKSKIPSTRNISNRPQPHDSNALQTKSKLSLDSRPKVPLKPITTRRPTSSPHSSNTKSANTTTQLSDPKRNNLSSHQPSAPINAKLSYKDLLSSAPQKGMGLVSKKPLVNNSSRELKPSSVSSSTSTNRSTYLHNKSPYPENNNPKQLKSISSSSYRDQPQSNRVPPTSVSDRLKQPISRKPAQLSESRRTLQKTDGNTIDRQTRIERQKRADSSIQRKALDKQDPPSSKKTDKSQASTTSTALKKPIRKLPPIDRYGIKSSKRKPSPDSSYSAAESSKRSSVTSSKRKYDEREDSASSSVRKSEYRSNNSSRARTDERRNEARNPRHFSNYRKGFNNGHRGSYYDNGDDYDDDDDSLKDFVVDDDEDEDYYGGNHYPKIDYRSEIRKLTGYDSRKYRDSYADQDSDDMEANASSQLREETISLKIAKIEDKIEEERLLKLEKMKKRRL